MEINELKAAIYGVTGCDKVRRQASGQWDILYHKHPQNCGSDGHFVLYAMSDKEAQERALR